MIHGTVQQLLAASREKPPPRSQEVFEFAQVVVREGAADSERQIGTRSASARPSPRHAIAVVIIVGRVLGSCPAVRQRERRPRDGDDRGTRHIEREEPDGASTQCIDHVRSHVDLDEAPEPGKGRHRTELHVSHLERDQPDPRRSVERVDANIGREQSLHRVGVIPPMEIGELRPALLQDRTALPQWWLGRDGFEEHDRQNLR